MVLDRRLVIRSRGCIVKEHVINQERRQGNVTLARKGYSVGGMLWRRLLSRGHVIRCYILQKGVLWGQEGVCKVKEHDINLERRLKLPLPAKGTR